ncbi:LysR family transcriptional regulator [Rhodohalobacter sulfatireducens]|uniref:LysR family transcriptional regulator n=1 Tax=Rhodohalobacter sulfatireducens TaxID=2911366 RepID=A0ABS9KCB7_9BACT|nr:LysR family transcriptional regulator [Rhodohalobacter sulfatireducens]MCG2588494.1 LysR family transcriptional regulator [Rhodohalobacter sulfatireducens]MDR9364472.1 LysR family transcriptional regulator [Balneolaceae bacterium]MDR9407396.1 LysR family transcriptional regulator [Balneolaceae bacterium]
MNYTLHQLKVFAEVAKCRSITKAAESLHMTQPAVSIQMKQLQESVDIPLIEIIGKKLYLTEAGERLYSMQQTIQEHEEAFQAYTSELKGGLTGNLSISAASTAKYFLPYLLGAFQKKYPKVKITLKVTNRDEVLQHLYDNKFQLAILTQLPDDSTIISNPFLINPLVMACPPDYPLLNKKNLTLKDLKDETFIFREPGSGTRMVMERLLKEAVIEPTIAMELGTNEAVKQAIMAGIGISLISKLSMYSELDTGTIDELHLKEFPVTTHWHTLYRKSKVNTRVIKNFLDFLQQDNLTDILPSN